MLVSRMYRAILNIVPTQERLAWISSNNSNGMCPFCPTKIENCWHALMQCCLSQNAANYLLDSIQRIQPSAYFPDILYLQWDHNEYFLPLSQFAIPGIYIIWGNRLSGGIQTLSFYSELRAWLSILLKTKHVKEARIIESALIYLSQADTGIQACSLYQSVSNRQNEG